jgi:periplasmic divalent cation tolerance protein
MSEARIVLTTAGSAEEGRKVARLLVERHLAACVNIVPRIESIYRWQGAVEQGEEVLLMIKTTRSRFSEVREAIQQNHSYDMPECVSVPIDDGSDKYLNWISESVSAQE